MVLTSINDGCLSWPRLVCKVGHESNSVKSSIIFKYGEITVRNGLHLIYFLLFHLFSENDNTKYRNASGRCKDKNGTLAILDSPTKNNHIFTRLKQHGNSR